MIGTIIVIVFVVSTAFMVYTWVDLRRNPSLAAPARYRHRGETFIPSPIRVYTRRAKWAPSPIDATMVQNGEWDTNRNPSYFITNKEPVFDRKQRVEEQRFVPQIPNATFSTGFPDPPTGGEYQFDGVFGRV